MAKITLNDVANLSGNPTSAEVTVNANSAAIEAALENTLSRDGTAPNNMTASLDMNSNRVRNVRAPALSSDVATKEYADTLLQGTTDTGSAQLRLDLASAATDDGTKGFHVVYYPPLSGETGIENYQYSYNNVLRFIPLNLHSSIRDGTNTTALQTYIQNAFDSLSEGGDMIFPHGDYKVTAQVSMSTSHVNISMYGRIVNAGTAIGIKIGSDTALTHDVHAKLYVDSDTVSDSDWATGKTGIQMMNCYSADITVHRCRGFATGLHVTATAGYGSLYNKFFLGTCNTNKSAVKLEGDQTLPVNENNFYGGRLNATGSSGNNGFASIYIIDGGAGGGGNVNSNKFYGCSVEASGFCDWLVYCDGGWYNAFYDLRYEGSPTKYVHLSADTDSNRFSYGFNSFNLKDSAYVEDLGNDNELEGYSFYPSTLYRSFASGHLVASQANITDVTWTKVLIDTEKYDLGGDMDIANNKFTAPVTGYYRVTGQIGFTSASVLAGEYRAAIYINGGLLADSRVPGVAGNTMTAQITKTFLVTAGQDIELYTYLSVGANTVDLHTGENNTFLEVELVKK